MMGMRMRRPRRWSLLLVGFEVVIKVVGRMMVLALGRRLVVRLVVMHTASERLIIRRT